MKKRRKARLLLELLQKQSNISLACEKLDISRNTVYRWRKEDPKFASEMDEAMEQGRDSISDFAESQLVGHIRDGKPWAIKYWLDNNKRNYVRPRLKDVWRPENQPRGVTIKFVDMSNKEIDISKQQDSPEEENNR
jgi:hypothetical protein